MRLPSNQKMCRLKSYLERNFQRHTVSPNLHFLEQYHTTSTVSFHASCITSLNRRLTNKLSEAPPGPVCVITGYPAKFRDPLTGLPYCNAYAYKEIHRLKRGDYVWSSLIQAYIGQAHYAARGVPARFLQPRPS